MIYFAFVHTHILYGVEVYANTTSNHLSELAVLNNKLLRILQNKQHTTLNCIQLILLFLYTYCTIINFLYLFISMSTRGLNYLRYFLLI